MVKVGKSSINVGSISNEGISTFWVQKMALKKWMEFVEVHAIL